MTRKRKLLLGLLIAVSGLAADGLASAATLTVTPGSISAISANTLTFTGGGLTISCPFTINGTFGSPISSATLSDVTVGAITGGTPGTPCTGANAFIFLGFPWALRWTLVLNGDGSIDLRSAIRNLQAALNYPIAGICLYQGDLIASRRFASGTTQPLTLSQLDFASQTIPRQSGGILCPSSWGLTGFVRLGSTISASFAL